jgi:hypothetical protein
MHRRSAAIHKPPIIARSPHYWLPWILQSGEQRARHPAGAGLAEIAILGDDFEQKPTRPLDRRSMPCWPGLRRELDRRVRQHRRRRPKPAG